MDKPFEPYDRLANRTFGGFLVAEFLAAFNDQCIHASAMFFAIRTGIMTPDKAIGLMPILFYSPWALFCTLSGYFADRFSKRTSLIFWKVAEVGITAFALVGFWLGAHPDLVPNGDKFGPWMVLACVFLMGTHSAFYVPAKYGFLPEIFKPHLLSRANGFVESTSFLAVILGTATGGALSYYWRNEEHKIGIFLVFSALIGTLTSFLIRRIPAADPTRPFPGFAPWRLYGPLFQHLKLVFRSRPLALALLGIAFFTFMVAYMRVTMYMHGESQNPPWSELKISIVVAVVALGIGIGSPLAGYLSGGKVELGLVPLGAAGIILLTLLASFFVFLHHDYGLMFALAGLGFCAGFYIVPLYTLMQHRAPKGQKGITVATSNFINVTGAIAASLVFVTLVGLLHRLGVAPAVSTEELKTGRLVKLDREKKEGIRVVSFELDTDGNGKSDFGVDVHKGVGTLSTPKPATERHPTASPEADDGLDLGFGEAREQKVGINFDRGIELHNEVTVYKYTVYSKSARRDLDYYRVQLKGTPERVQYDDQNIPVYLFIAASGMAALVLLLLYRKLPDFFVRTFLWMRSYGRYKVRVAGLVNLPTDGPAILVTNCCRFQDSMHVLAATDRTLKFLLIERILDDEKRPFLRFLARTTGLTALHPDVGPADFQAAVQSGLKALKQNHLVAISADTDGCREQYLWLLEGLRRNNPQKIVPVYCGTLPASEVSPKEALRIRVLFGAPLPPDASPETIQHAIDQLGHKAPQLDSMASIMIH